MQLELIVEMVEEIGLQKIWFSGGNTLTQQAEKWLLKSKFMKIRLLICLKKLQFKF